MTTFNEAAAAGYKSLVDLYQPEVFEGNFWFGGNTLHCCLNYLLSITGQKNDGGILFKAYRIYQDLDAKGGWWVDDYGWWGNAFLLALYNWSDLDFSDGNQLKKDDITRAAEHCWEKLAGHWSEDTYNKGGEDHAADTAPFRGGTFNLKDINQRMAGRNTVTNLGFLLLSRGLAQLNPNDPGQGKYQEMATAELQWFDNWLGLPKSLLTEQNLVLERPRGNAADPDWYWTGDQGQFVLAMGSGRDVSQRVAAAVLKRMTDSDGILHEYEISGALGEFIADYATGKGIFMRCMQALYGASGNASYLAFVRNNAASVWATATQGSNGGCQFKFNWSRRPGVWEPATLSGKDQQLCDLILQTAGQDALNAALALNLGGETIK